LRRPSTGLSEFCDPGLLPGPSGKEAGALT
jgi:hypothetical protein